MGQGGTTGGTPPRQRATQFGLDEMSRNAAKHARALGRQRPFPPRENPLAGGASTGGAVGPVGAGGATTDRG